MAIVLIVFGVAAGAVILARNTRTTEEVHDSAMSRTGKEGLFYPTTAQWATLMVEPVQQRVFRSEHVTEGKITIDEDRSTPIFSPYAGRVTKLLCMSSEHFGRLAA
jgi:membrane fusion protein, heavy metal efflux system